MAEDSEHRHRPGAMKQKNKGHKHGRHRTKGQIDRDNQGRVNVKTISKKSSAQFKKMERRNQAQQIRKQKRDEALMKKRQRGGTNTPPHLVAVIPLCSTENTRKALELLQKAVGEMEDSDPDTFGSENEQGILHLTIPRFRKRVALYTPPAQSLHAILDAAKVADTVMFVMSPSTDLDETTDFLFSSLMGQGMPSATFVYHGLANLPVKKVAETKKSLQKVFENRFPDAKLLSLDKTQDAQVVLRHLTDGKLKPVHYREKRPHLIAENLSFEAESADATVGTLKVSGYLRGAAMSVDRLVYLMGWDNYQVTQIDSAPDPHPLVLKAGKQRSQTKQDAEMETEESSGAVTVLARADPQKQESLQSEVEPDPMEGEQTWPTAEELEEAENEVKKKKKLPKGFSEYQSAWIVSDDEDEEDDGDESEDENMAPMEQSDSSEEDDDDEDDEDEDGEEMATTDGEDTDKYDAAYDMDEEKEIFEKMKDERQHVMFPDEIDTPHDLPARERFARYRGLQSFRTSPWHKDEELPPEYARIYRFSNLKLLQREILKRQIPDAVQPGQYITVHIANVPKTFMETYKPGEPVILFGMLPYEQCMSVIHFVVRRSQAFTGTVRSKDRLVFQVGYRRFTACPIYSQHTSGDKQKFERYLPQEGAVVATVFAPIIFGPAPVLMFSPGQDQLVASGSLLSDNPDRIIIKRTVLSGAPFKINKRTATIRFMFFNREDILWFKKIELKTKWGRRGRILEPLGTHGHMKCYFSTQLKSQDTVLMNLYKRQFPKWTYSTTVPIPMPITWSNEEEKEGDAYQLFD